MASKFAIQFFFFTLLTLLAAPVVAQTQIGGGTCNSSSLNGIYALSLTGRQIANTGAFTSVLQANGTATFDGLSTVSIALTEDNNQAAATTLAWSGTYSVEANCIAVVNITTGGTVTLNVAIDNQGKDFQLTGSDATYSYAGSGTAQPSSASCSTSTLSGVYTFNASGYQLTSGAVSGAATAGGLLQFDGAGNLSVNMTLWAGGAISSAVTLTGTYSVSSNCVGKATLSDSSSNSYNMSLSIYSVNAANTNFYATLARAANLVIAGAGHTAYGEPATPNPQAGTQPISGGTCATANLSGVYPFTLSGRGISTAGIFAGSFQGVGTASFDGKGNVTLAGTDNTNLAQGQQFSYTGTYSIPSNCSGTLTVTTASTATFTLVVWDTGSDFAIEGSDSTYVYSGSGTLNQPPACATPTLSGEYTFTANGFTLSGTTQTGSEDEAGVLQFDGQGNVTASYTDTQGGITPVATTASGTYAVTSGCLASATLSGSSGASNAFHFAIAGIYGQTLDLIAASSQFVRTGSAHSAFPNPSENIGNVASYAYNATPPGSIFVLFGQNFSTQSISGGTLPLPTKLGGTSVTVNGELAPLFYVGSDQIDAQMPWDIQGNTVASVIVMNGTSVSNAAAVYVPATGTPGIGAYSNNRAPVVNQDGVINSASAPASVGDVVTIYFTGGGPVQASGQLKTGDASPAGLSPLNGTYSITVGTAPATITYIGLTPGSVGLYQASFYVPNVAKGTYPVAITISGYTSNTPVMTVSN